jgi:hypothetical protein
MKDINVDALAENVKQFGGSWKKIIMAIAIFCPVYQPSAFKHVIHYLNFP